MVILPCKIGDIVYTIEERYYNYSYHKGIQRGYVSGYEYDGKTWIVWVRLDQDSPLSGNGYKFENFGKTIFLSMERAEKALEKLTKTGKE